MLYSFIKTGIQSDSITAFAAKFFGFEIQFKRNSEKIDSALNDMLESKKQMNFMADLNNYTLELISSDFEENILNADNINERIRENIEGILDIQQGIDTLREISCTMEPKKKAAKNKKR